MRAAEALAMAGGVTGLDLMERAGRSAADVLQARFPERPVVVLCGPGGNGGDGFVVARLLREAGCGVRVFVCPGVVDQKEGDAASMRAMWGDAVSPLAAFRPSAGEVVVDALFGIGLLRPLSGETAAIVAAVNDAGASVFSLDIPSGLSGDRGDIGGVSISAEVTVTFTALKPVHLLAPASRRCGEVVVADIGVPLEFMERAGAACWRNGTELWAKAFPWPDDLTHKHRRGRMFVLSGGLAATGAARLAARAGLRIGAGLVTLLCPPSGLLAAASQSTAVMTAQVADVADLLGKTRDADVVVVGPANGVTQQTRQHVEALIAAGRSLVLDADALTVFAGEPGLLRPQPGAEVILTPHTGEFERLFPGALARAANKIEAVRAAARDTGCVVLLKGPDTVIAHPDGRAVVNVHASPFLATAGSGDVLAGAVAGLRAQGCSAFDAACAAAWIHGDAALRFGPGLIAEDLERIFPQVLRELNASRPRQRPPGRLV
ncbi:NAD(P)H-hydrate dehydratase [bacterium]|nr:NAD(P)H-hydrate dehydratase [bacterium]